MTDNEKRAHDLALIMAEHSISRGAVLAKVAGTEPQDDPANVTVDIYEEYLRAYNVAISAFNRDFPELNK